VKHISKALMATTAMIAISNPAFSQSATELPAVTVVGAPLNESLTVPTTEQAQEEIRRTPGAVEVIADTVFKNGPAATLKDVLDYVPGVFVQPKWGADTRLSIRGSSLSRNFHLRSIQLYMDGIPINTADGYGDFQEIDPGAYRHVDVYKGANALQFGGNSLGGAINFVTPSGRDASIAAVSADVGSFGFNRQQASSGAVVGPVDYFVTAARQQQEGWRDHTGGDSYRGSVNLGYQLTPDIETRFYVNANNVHQRIPGEVTKAAALLFPEGGANANKTNDYQRNIDTVRVANKTTLRFESTTVDLGAFGVDRQLLHPIFQLIDYSYKDYGGFIRAVDGRSILGHKNRAVVGFNIINGRIDNRQYANAKGLRGALQSSSFDSSENYIAYGEDSFSIIPNVAVVGGLQFLHAVRDRKDTFLSNGDASGRNSFSLLSPKVGLLWDVDPDWQAFANISRSAEVPSFGESGGAAVPFTTVKEQTATTYEVGTRGQRSNYKWNLAAYRAEIHNELQCLQSAVAGCNVTNVHRTIHQGLELGGGADFLHDLFSQKDKIGLNLAYTFNDFTFDSDRNYNDNQLPGAPRHFLRGEMLYKHPIGLSIGPNMEWVPKGYYADNANTLQTDPYVIFGMKAVQDFNENVSAYVEGRNLGNTAYISNASVINRATSASAQFNPGDGRSAFAGIRAKW